MANSAAGSDLLEHDQPERQPGQRRDRPQDLDDRIEHPVQRLRQPEQQSERRREGDAEEKAFRDPHQAVGGEQPDALIHLAAFLERLEQVELALLPGLQRRRQVRDGPAGDDPDQADQ